MFGPRGSEIPLHIVGNFSTTHFEGLWDCWIITVELLFRKNSLCCSHHPRWEYVLLLLPGSVRGWLIPRAAAAKLGGGGGSSWGVMWQQATRRVKSVCHATSVPAETKTNSSSRIVKLGRFVFGKLLFAHLIFWLWKNILFFFLPP